MWLVSFVPRILGAFKARTIHKADIAYRPPPSRIHQKERVGELGCA